MSSLRREEAKPTRDSGETIAFPPFTLDLRGGRLLRGAHPIPLRPKTWAVLCYLAERPGVLVSKEELFAQIWTGTAVGDDSLTKSIHEIRDALGDDFHLCRNSRESYDFAEQAISLSTEHGLTFTKAQATALAGWALVQQGEAKRAIHMIQQGLEEYRATGAKLLSSHLLAWQADAHRRLGDIKGGLTAVDEGLAIAETTLDGAYLAELWRIKGALLLASVDGSRSKGARGKRARVEEAEGCLQRALEIARAGHARSLELRAAIHLAQLWRDQSKAAAARALLGEIYGWFTEGFDTADLCDARALLDRFSG